MRAAAVFPAVPAWLGPTAAAVAAATAAATTVKPDPEMAKAVADAAKDAAAALAAVKTLQDDLAKLKKKVNILTGELDDERAAHVKTQAEVTRLKKLMD